MSTRRIQLRSSENRPKLSIDTRDEFSASPYSSNNSNLSDFDLADLDSVADLILSLPSPSASGSANASSSSSPRSGSSPDFGTSTSVSPTLSSTSPLSLRRAGAINFPARTFPPTSASAGATSGTTEWVLPHKSTWKAVGSGNFGNAFSAFDPITDRTVLIKQMPKSKVKEREWVTEAAILQHLSQPCGSYVVCFDNKFQDGENYYLVMEFLGEYVPLSEYLDRRMDARQVPVDVHSPNPVRVRKPGPYADPPTAQETMTIFCGLVAGLRQIHGLNIAHRDLKGENILINPKTLCVKYIDFGLSCWHKSLSDQAQAQVPLLSGTEGKDEIKRYTAARTSTGTGTGTGTGEDDNEGECSGEVGTALFEAPEVLLRDPPFDTSSGAPGSPGLSSLFGLSGSSGPLKVLPDFADLVATDLWSLGMLMYEFLSGNVYYEDYYEFTHSGDEPETSDLEPIVPRMTDFVAVGSGRPTSQNFNNGTSRTANNASTVVDENENDGRPDQEDDPIFILTYQLLNSMMSNPSDESLPYARDFLNQSVANRANIIGRRELENSEYAGEALAADEVKDVVEAVAESEVKQFLPLIDATLNLLQKSPNKRILPRLNCTEHTCGPRHNARYES